MTAVHLIFSPSSLEPLFCFSPCCFLCYHPHILFFATKPLTQHLILLWSCPLIQNSLINSLKCPNLFFLSFRCRSNYQSAVTMHLPVIFFFCPKPARAHTNFSHCGHFVGCDQFSVIWPQWFPAGQFLSCVRFQRCCCVAQHFQPFLRVEWEMKFCLLILEHNHGLYNTITFFLCKKINEKQKRTKLNWCYNRSDKLLLLPWVSCNFILEFNHTMFNEYCFHATSAPLILFR